MGVACGKNAQKRRPATRVIKYKLSAHDIATSSSDINQIYNIDPKVIGRSEFGIVRLATPANYSEHCPLAVKTIKKEKLKDNYKELLQRELRYMRDLDHPNIVRFYESYQDDVNFHIVMEYCSGGELMNYFTKKGHLTEQETSHIMGKALAAVNFLHERGVVHRDIKPENFMFKSTKPDAELKLIDFGLSRRAEAHEVLETRVGTPYYAAPEVLIGRYDYRCDIWSLGVIMYLFLSGDHPFDGENVFELGKNIVNQPLNFRNKIWEGVSQQAKDIVKGLLEKNPDQRKTIKQVLDSPWIKMGQQPRPIGAGEAQKVMDNLLKFSPEKIFKKIVLKFAAIFSDSEDIRRLHKIYYHFDKDNKGVVTIDDLRRVVKEQNLNISNEELLKVIKTVPCCPELGECISMTNFVMASMDEKRYITKKNILRVFSYFDVDNSGYITLDDVREIAQRISRKLTEEEMKRIITQTDLDRDGKIDLHEFCSFMGLDPKEIAEVEEATKSSKDTSIDSN